MLQSDWLSHCALSAISVQCLGVVDKIAMFPCFPNFESTFFKQMN